MTDANGSATASQPDAGTPDPAKGNADQGSNGNPSDPFAGLQDAGTREWIGTKGYKTIDDVASAARNAESLIGRSVQLPGADAKPEDWDKVVSAFESKLPEDRRAPEKADAYEFKLPDGLPENLPYDDSFAGEFKGAAHAAKLNKSQAAALHDFYVQKSAAFFTKQTEDVRNQVKTVGETIEKKWGEPGSDSHMKASDRVLTAIDNLKIKDALLGAGLIVPDPQGKLVLTNAEMAFALEAVGAKLYGEAKLELGDESGSSAGNPFAGNNATEQGIAWNRDRPTAERLIRQLGKKPEDFGFRA